MIKEYSDMTKESWTTVWDTNIVEFFTIVAFSREYKKRELRELRKWKKT